MEHVSKQALLEYALSCFLGDTVLEQLSIFQWCGYC